MFRGALFSDWRTTASNRGTKVGRFYRLVLRQEIETEETSWLNAKVLKCQARSGNCG